MRTGQQLEAYSTTFGLIVSVAVHVAALAYIARATAHYDFDFDLALPAEVEFGVTEGMELAIGGQANSPTAAGAGKSERRPDEVSEPDPDWETEREIETEAETDPNPISAPALEGPSRLPPGAQLALRIDMKRVRESPLGPDVTRFLEGVPDWQLILDGSGIDPVSDLDRLLVATPNLQRAKLVFAGKHRREANFARQSVQRLARSRGKGVRWRESFGVPIAPWHNRDRTPRTIALLGPRHFSITRRQDVKRVLALARARELRDPEQEGLVVARGPDALLSMGPDEAISLEVEGVHRFVIGNVEHVPVRLRVAVRETGPNEATVSALATYASPADAAQASAYWKRVASFYSNQLIVSLAGFGKTLRKLELMVEDERVRVTFKLNADQIRFILSYAEGRLRGSGGATRPRQPGERW